ncbi:hypothetical protein TSACC_22287 [Terrimicrobium sacchariphilum]|uniref:Uncharacterized protein n=1 Tax=Terrimicrobium sacchariphilum TaxID=690879 RepID=A0A146GAP6_TERSA|nr:hypothetical protein TSACC_22287 [Terrimicrobium sacchariphilum]
MPEVPASSEELVSGMPKPNGLTHPTLAMETGMGTDDDMVFLTVRSSCYVRVAKLYLDVLDAVAMRSQRRQTRETAATHRPTTNPIHTPAGPIPV